MAKRKITYSDGTSVVEDIPNEQVIPGLEKLNNALPEAPKLKLPKRLDPSQRTTLSDQFGDFLGDTIADPFDQLGAGIHDAFTKHNTVDGRLGGIADAIKGGGKVALTLGAAGGSVPTTLKGLARAGLGVGGAYLGDKAATDVAQRMKAGPGASELAGAGGAALGGGLGYKIPDIALSDALALKSGGLVGLLKKLALGQGGSSTPKATTAPQTPATAIPAKSLEEAAIEKALAKAAGDKAYAAAMPKPTETPALPNGFAGYADPANTASTVTGSPVQSRLLGPAPTATPIGSLPLNPPKPRTFGPPISDASHSEAENQAIRAARSSGERGDLKFRAERDYARTVKNQAEVEASANAASASKQPLIQPSSTAKPVQVDAGDLHRRMQDAKLTEGLKQDSAGRWMKGGKLVSKTYMQQLADQYGFKDWQ